MARTSRSKPARRRTKLPDEKHQKIHVITDKTGGLPRHMLAAILTQFPELEEDVNYTVFVDDLAKVTSAFRKIRRPALILYAVAEPHIKTSILEHAEARSIPAYDMTGGLVDFLAQQTGLEPLNDAGRIHEKGEAYFNRIDAWEFSLQHDDSRRLESIAEADIVLVGPSRVSKTPTSAYLGWLGFRVANVSIAPEIDLPRELKSCRGKVVALSMQPKRLAEIRTRRLQVNGFAKAAKSKSRAFAYASVRDTIREVAYAESAYRKCKIPVIDTTDLSVEETAARVLDVLGLH